jgi:ATP-dependent DNA helicase RecG
MSMLLAIDNGFQACLMAPTEILANQHFLGLSELAKTANINIKILTGSTKTAERKVIHEALEDGSLHILIGTHALLEDKVQSNITVTGFLHEFDLVANTDYRTVYPEFCLLE